MYVWLPFLTSTFVEHSNGASAEQVSSSRAVQPKPLRALPTKSDPSKARLSPPLDLPDTSLSLNKSPPGIY